MLWSPGIPPKVAFLCSEALDNVLTMDHLPAGRGLICARQHPRQRNSYYSLSAHLYLGFISVSV